MKAYISIVSHGHEQILKNSGLLNSLASQFTVIIKNNKKENKSKLNDMFGEIKNLIIIDEKYNLGFGENNNFIYKYCIDQLDIKNDDYFCVINPDILISPETLTATLELMSENNIELSTIPLYTDNSYTQLDNSIRKFPTLSTFIRSFLKMKNESVHIDTTSTYQKADWAAGSFLIFKSSLYKEVNGFNENYFMYCEDIDICRKVQKTGRNLYYFSNLKAIHDAQRNNRKIFSKHFYWHLRSVFIYLTSSPKNRQ